MQQNNSISPFNEQILFLHRTRHAKEFNKYFSLYTTVCHNILEDLRNIKFNREIKNILDLSAKNGYLLDNLPSNLSTANLYYANAINKLQSNYHLFDSNNVKEKFDLIVAPLHLHLINNLPQYLINIKNLLHKDGFFMGTLMGPSTLQELWETFENVEINLHQRLSPRIIPMIKSIDAVSLMKYSGFKDIVVNSSIFELHFNSMRHLCRFIKGNGESNPLTIQNQFLCGKNLFSEFENYYHQHFQVNTSYKASFEVIFIFATA